MSHSGSLGIPFVQIGDTCFNPHTIVMIQPGTGETVRISFINGDTLDVDNGDVDALYKQIRDAMAAQL